MNLLLFFIVIIILGITVRIGAIALELTGLHLEMAQFQALSCFTGTGFTTKESELIAEQPQRRRIASILMILGYAGFVTLIATFANSIREHTDILHFQVPVLGLYIPAGLLPLFNLLLLVGIGYVLYSILKKVVFEDKFANAIRSHMLKKDIIMPVSFQELFIATHGYGVCSIHVGRDSLLVNKRLHELALRKDDIVVLGIEKHGKVITLPTVETEISKGDKLICFGNLNEIKKKLVARHREV